MGIAEKIEQIIKEEATRRMIETMKRLVPILCRDYPEQFMYDQIWRELGKLDEIYKSIPVPESHKSIIKRCKGLSKNGTPCRWKVRDGLEYCHVHKDQKPIPPPQKPIPLTGIKHNHNVMRLRYSSDCPACQFNSRKEEHPCHS